VVDSVSVVCRIMCVTKMLSWLGGEAGTQPMSYHSGFFVQFLYAFDYLEDCTCVIKCLAGLEACAGTQSVSDLSG
jgi:hypothetical protein